jgi:hydroxyethylthiazole kinase-like uncharacterized protein yjeF
LSSSAQKLPTLNSRQVKAADALAGGRFGIPIDWLMEAAGWQVARFCDGRTTVVCGPGNNGGDGLAAARHLHRWGRLARVCCVDVARLHDAPARQLAALHSLGVKVESNIELDGSQIVLDALLGTGISRAPDGKLASWIEAINSSEQRVVAVDLPSGLDADSGRAYAPCLRATTTVTLGLPKTGLLDQDGPRVAGEVWVADIGMPFEVYLAMGIEVSPGLFLTSDRVRL